MTETIALSMIPLLVKQSGYCGYELSYRHFILAPGELRYLALGSDFFLHLSEKGKERVQIESEFGFYDSQDPKSNELEYVHTSYLTIKSLESQNPVSLYFLQVKPQSSTHGN